MRDSREPLRTDGYQRPQQAWHCGLADVGPTCPLGPDGSGHCPAAAACRPVRDGDRWHCNRSALRGGPCDEGPGHDGACAIHYRCSPVRSLRKRRGRFVGGFAMAAIGAACMALSGPWRNELIAPGALSAHHAPLFEGQTPRCAQCHAAAEATLAQWWAHSTHGESSTPAQSVLCLECHQQTVPPEFVTSAHGVPASQLASGGGDAPARWQGRLRDPREPIACAACHREHQGLNHSLTTLTNVACQACHREQYDSFAGTHPDFGSWPYERPTRIVFDHRSHNSKHFPEENRKFDCSTCHQSDTSGERQLTLHYSVACAECHDKAIAASLTDGIPLVSLPAVDVKALADAGHSPAAWPEEVTGDFDGAPPMIAKILIAADVRGAQALSVLGPQFDFFDLDSTDKTQLAAAGDVADAIKTLVDDLADRGHASIAERLDAVLGRKLTSTELAALTASLSPHVAADYRDRWFGQPAAAIAGKEHRASQLEKVSAGGWIRDDPTFSLRYRAMGHADPWLRAWLDVLAEAATGSHHSLADPLLQAALRPTAPGQCGQCHALDRGSKGRVAIQWRAFQPENEPRRFTRFDHGPHVLSKSSNCTSCHRLGDGTGATVGAAAHPGQFAAGFEPMSKASCNGCHKPHIAGDSCTQCHRYHERSP